MLIGLVNSFSHLQRCIKKVATMLVGADGGTSMTARSISLLSTDLPLTSISSKEREAGCMDDVDFMMWLINTLHIL